MPNPNTIPTPEQSTILSALSHHTNIIVEALAGTGKSTLLSMCAHTRPTSSILYLAFNKRIVEEMEPRLPPLATTKTINSLGHSTLASALGKRLRLDTRKPYSLLSQLLEREKLSLTYPEKQSVIALFNAARTFNMRPDSLDWEYLWEWTELTPDPELHPFVEKLFTLSIQEAELGYIDFLDQIYMPVYLNLKFQKFSLLLVDEAQDMSELNLAFISLIPATQRIFVGDPNQAIYAFRGAAHDSMEKISQMYPDSGHFPLSITFRCPKAIVARAQSYVPRYEAAPQNPEGSVETLSRWNHTQITPNSAIICRNNAPLITLALKLLAKKIKVKILGREFSEAIIRDIKKACPKNVPIAEVEGSLSELYLSQLRKSEKKSFDSNHDKIMDKLDAILAAGEGATDRDSLISLLEEIFSETQSTITLCSGHKSKGLEWDTVIHLSPELIPSPYALKSGDPDALTQESNLRYVIETRSREKLILASLSTYQD